MGYVAIMEVKVYNIYSISYSWDSIYIWDIYTVSSGDLSYDLQFMVHLDGPLTSMIYPTKRDVLSN